MPDSAPLHDVTGTVRLDDPAGVADAAEEILVQCYGAGSFDRDLLHVGFAFTASLYRGRQPGWLACDLPYHDLRHALDAALVAARLVDGVVRDGAPDAEALTPEFALAAVLLALLHDTGFLRREDEASLCGPQLAPTHEHRSVACATTWLAVTSLAPHAGLAELILATRVAQSPAQLLAGRTVAEATIACIVGTADLLCQVADPRYPERCYHHLYPELVLGGGDRVRTADGQEKRLFASAMDLLARTPAFHANVVAPRLQDGLMNVAGHLAAHFDGADPYADSTRSNLARCERIVDGGLDLLGGPPPTTTEGLAPIYRGEA